MKLLLDERAWWPRAFYDRACICSGNYDGVDCSECKHGYEGDLCQIKSPLRIRKNLKLMSTAEIQVSTIKVNHHLFMQQFGKVKQAFV